MYDLTYTESRDAEPIGLLEVESPYEYPPIHHEKWYHGSPATCDEVVNNGKVGLRRNGKSRAVRRR